MTTSSPTRRWFVPVVIVSLACIGLVLYATGCRIIDPGYGDGLDEGAPSVTIARVEVSPGQEVRVTSDFFEVFVPAGAVTRDNKLIVDRTDRSANLFPVPASWTMLSHAFTLTLSRPEAYLQKPASIRIPFDASLMPTGADQTDIFVACYEQNSGFRLLTPSVDLTQGLAMVETYHFSIWAVLARPPDLRPKSFVVSPRLETEPPIMAAAAATRFLRDLLFTISFDIPAGASSINALSGWYLQFFPIRATRLDLAHPTIDANRRTLVEAYPFLEPVDLLKDPFVTRTSEGSRGTLNTRLIFTDKTPAEAPTTLIWRLACRDPLGFFYEREGQVTFTVEDRRITLISPLGSVLPGQSLNFSWNLFPLAGAYESVLLQIAATPEGFLLPLFETSLQPATTTHTLDQDVTSLLPQGKPLYWRIVGTDLYKNRPTSSAGQFRIGFTADPFEVITTLPASSSRNVSPGTSISVVFNRAVATATILPGLTITPAVTGDLSTSANSFTFVPETHLLENNNYVIGLATTVKDLAGNGLAQPFELSFTTGTLGAAGYVNVLQFVPPAGALDVPTRQLLELVFDRDMVPLSVQTAFQITPAPGGAPTWTWVTPRYARVSYPAGLAAATPYQVTLAESATSVTGEVLQNPIGWSFYTSVQGDVTPPILVSINPIDGARNVPTNAQISFSFNEPMDITAVEGAISVVSPAVSPLQFTWLPGGKTVSVKPQNGWLSNSTHQILVQTGVTDVSGNRLEASRQISFSTSGQTGPILVSSKPANGELTANPISQLSFTFDRSMNPEKVQAAFSVTPKPLAAPTFLWSANNTLLSVAYPSPFSDSVDVTVEFSAQAQDSAGQALVGPVNITFRPGDFAAPAFVGTNPASGTTAVPLNAQIVFQFSEAMSQTTPERFITLVPALSDLTHAWNSTRTELSLGRTIPWPAGTLQTLTVSGDLKDAAGNRLGASTTVSLTFGSTSAPTLTAYSPANGSTGVSRTAAISLTFDRAMTHPTTEAALAVVPAATLTPSWSGDSRTLTLTPATPLSNQTLYQITLSPAATDQSGVSLVATRTFSFSTADTLPPGLLSASPTHLSFGVPRNTSLSFTFSEPVDTVAAQGAFSLSPAPPAPTFTWTNANRTLNVTFAAQLTAETTYQAVFGTTLRDLSGNTLTAPLEVEFNTESTVLPLIAQFQPAEGTTAVAMNASLLFTFNKAMATSTVQVSISPDPGGTHVYSWSSDLKTLTFKTGVNLSGSQAYSVQVSPTAQDAFHNVLTGTRTVAFSTGSNLAANALFSPAHGAAGIAVTTKPVLTFDKAMNQASVLAGLTITPAPGSITPGWSGDSLTLTLDLGTLSTLTTYTVSLAPTIVDAAGVPLGRTIAASFLTRHGAPTITVFDPANTATGIGLTTPIRVTFSQPMTPGSVTLTMTPEPLGTRSIGWSADFQTLTATWTIGFEATQNYQMDIGASSQDTFGQTLAGVRTAQFQTATVAGPVVQSFQPSISTQGVSRSTHLIAVFDRPMDQANTQAAFSLTPAAVPSFSWSGDGKTLDVSFGSALEYDTFYTAAFQSTARDLNQVKLAGTFSSWFVTESRPAILPGGVTPAVGATEVASGASIRVAFSKTMDQPTTQSAFNLKAGSTAVAGTFTWEANTLVFKPSSSLPAATTCTISVTTGARDPAGNTLAAPWSSTFNTFVPDLSIWQEDLALLPGGSATQFSPRSGHAVVTFNNRLWVIGGFDDDFRNDVWSTADGVTWTQATANAAFSARRNHSCAVWNNAIWLTGGVNLVNDADGFPVDNYLDDVWRSTDGVTWTQISASAEYYSRSEHAMVVFNNQLWMAGGITTDTDGNTVLLGDTWSTSNGTNWAEHSLVVGFSERRGPAAFVALNRLWVVGGFGVDTLTQLQKPLNDVWSSLNGDTWGRVSASTPFQGRVGAGFAFYKNRLTLCGGSGMDSGGWDISFNDVWTSSDGQVWNQNLADGPETGTHFSRRYQHHLSALGARLYLIGGDAGDTTANDVWSTP